MNILITIKALIDGNHLAQGIFILLFLILILCQEIKLI
jgi:hypothetical protein